MIVEHNLDFGKSSTLSREIAIIRRKREPYMLSDSGGTAHPCIRSLSVREMTNEAEIVSSNEISKRFGVCVTTTHLVNGRFFQGISISAIK